MAGNRELRTVDGYYYNMEILDRLYNIIRSKINSNKEEFDYANINFNEYHEKKREFNPGNIPNQDSDLARYYSNLEIPYGSDIETAKKAWKKLMKKYHPDLHARTPEKRETATLLTQELTRAYNEIKKSFE